MWIAGRRDSTVFGVVDDTTTTKFANRACVVHGISLPVVVDRVVVVVLKFPIINKQTSKHPMIVNLVRDLVLTSLRHNILFRPYHIPGVDNTRADLISRLQIVDFRKAFPDADPEPTHVPETLLPQKWSIR